MWRTLQRLAGSELTLTELASALADQPVTVSGQDKPVQMRDLPGMDAVAFQSWAKKLSLADPDAVQYHIAGRLAEYVENLNVDAALHSSG